MEPLRILFLTNKPPFPTTDGGTIASMGLIRSLVNAGCHVCVHSMNTIKHHSTFDDIPSDLHGKAQFILTEVPAPITISGAVKNLLFSNLPYNAERFIRNNFKYDLEQILQNQEFDIVQLEGLYLCPYIPTIRKLSKAKVVYRSHNIEHEIWERTLMQATGTKHIYISILTKRLKRFETKMMNQYDAVIPITPRDENILRQLGNTKKSFTVPAGFDMPEELSEQTPPDNLNLFFIGSLDWRPNHEAILWFLENCWPTIIKSKPNTTLKIAGRNAPAWFVQKIKGKGIEYIGEVKDAPTYIVENGIMIAPLLSGSGMRVKIVEGMRYGKTIITTSIGCEGIDVINEQELYIADTPAQFAAYAISLLSNPLQVVETGKKAFIFVRNHFNNTALAERLITFYKKL